MDFATYYVAARALWEGKDLYQIDGSQWFALGKESGIPTTLGIYVYPPLFAILMALLAWLPFSAAAVFSGSDGLGRDYLGLILGERIFVRPLGPVVYMALPSLRSLVSPCERDDELRAIQWDPALPDPSRMDLLTRSLRMDPRPGRSGALHPDLGQNVAGAAGPLLSEPKISSTAALDWDRVFVAGGASGADPGL